MASGGEALSEDGIDAFGVGAAAGDTDILEQDLDGIGKARAKAAPSSNARI